MDADKRQTATAFDRWSSWWDRAYRFNRAVYAAVVARVGPDSLRILDVGCGTGILARLLASADDRRTIHGIDLSPRMVQKAQNAAARFEDGRVSFSIGDAEALPFPDGAFDAITNTLSFHHFPNPQTALSEMYRVLRPGGLLVIADVAPPRPLARLLTRANVIYRSLAGAEWVRTPGEITALLAGAGFHLEETAPAAYFLPARVFVARRREPGSLSL